MDNIGINEGRQVGGFSGGVDQEKNQVRRLRASPRALNADRLDLAGAFTHAGGIGQADFDAVEVQGELDQVAGRAGFVGHDRRVAAGQRIQQARLSGIRRADDDDVKSVADDFGPVIAADMLPDIGEQLLHVGPDDIGDRARHVGFIGEIELGLDHRPRMDEPLAPVGIETGLCPIGIKHGHTTLRFGLGRYDIGEGFGFDQIELSVKKGPTGELAGLGKTNAWKPCQGVEQGGDNRLAAVDLKLGTVFAGEAPRRREK